MSAIGKAPVSGRVRVAGVNVDGDDQADRTVHGGPDKAVYAYAHEDSLWWSARLAREVGPGMFGENLTVEGVDVSGAVPAVTIAQVAHAIMLDESELEAAAAAPELPAELARWMLDRAA